MKTEMKTYDEYWAEVQKVFAYGDVLTILERDGEEVLEYRNSCGCLLSRYYIDKEIAEYN